MPLKIRNRRCELLLECWAGRNLDRDVPGMDDLHVSVFNAMPPNRCGSGASRCPSGVSFQSRRAEPASVARDVPAFGYRRFRVQQVEPCREEKDSGTAIEVGGIRAEVEESGSLAVVMGGHCWEGLFAIEDIGDRGDTYDFEPVGEATEPTLVSASVSRVRPESGVQSLQVDRVFSIPTSLGGAREERSKEVTGIMVGVEVVVATGRTPARQDQRRFDRPRSPAQGRLPNWSSVREVHRRHHLWCHHTLDRTTSIDQLGTPSPLDLLPTRTRLGQWPRCGGTGTARGGGDARGE